jgi:hypothetical protein
MNVSNKKKIMIYFILWTFRKKRLETYLNGKKTYLITETLVHNHTSSFFFLQSKQGIFCTKSSPIQLKPNSVPNQLLPRKQPGLYMIRCQFNDWRYYGESSNVLGRLASHKSLLNRQIHPNKFLQKDWDLYGENRFDFIILFMGSEWDLSYIRRGKETELIVLDRAFSYNILESRSRPGEKNPFWKRLHSPETKKKISQSLKSRPNDLLGKKIVIKKVAYPSIAEASRQTGIARKTIRNNIYDTTNQDYILFSEE